MPAVSKLQQDAPSSWAIKPVWRSILDFLGGKSSFLISRGKWQHLFNHLQMWAIPQINWVSAVLWSPSRGKVLWIVCVLPCWQGQIRMVLFCFEMLSFASLLPHHQKKKKKKRFLIKESVQFWRKMLRKYYFPSAITWFICRESFPAYSVWDS